MRSEPEAPPTSDSSVAAPVAVVSVGCRLPGDIGDLADLSRVLQRGESVLQPVPVDRWGPEFADSQQSTGTTRCHVGAFLSDIQRFDAEFFGISPREAREMDPQQRVLLEVAWDALNAAGRPVADWAGSRTGVFTGVLASDYLLLHSKTRGTAAIDPFYATGKEFSFGAGRVAYSFDLHGPVMTVTTACSSSLLAVHLACQSLRAGECDAALAGGVNLLVAPELTVFMSQVGAVSPTGRSAPFSATADGVVRGEGCALVLLKRLDDAQRDGDEILAVINGSAVNHDGHSAGLTVPSAAAQVRLIRQALSSGGIPPEEIGYLEAHATGTPLGDPIELAALDAVFDRKDSAAGPLLVGSHKAIFGHLDSAAGILGLLKAIVVVRDGLVPPQPVLDALTPNFDWASSGLRVATEPSRIETADHRPRRAGVSAFGLSGTNVHVVVSQPPPALPGTARNTTRHQGRQWSGDSHWLAGVRPGEQGPVSVPRRTASTGPELPVAAPPAAALPAAALPAAAPQAANLPAAVTGEIRDRVNAAVREVLGLDSGKPVPAQRPLLEQGLTSITAVELAALLATSFGTPKDPTLVYLCPRVDDLVAHFAEMGVRSDEANGSGATAVPVAEAASPASSIAASPALATPAQSTPAITGDSRPDPAGTGSRTDPAGIPDHSGPLAIVGMACRVPGAADIENFWQVIRGGAAQISDLSEQRRSRDGWSTVPDGVPTRGGYLDNIAGFDAAYFRISPMEAERIDPQQRLFLEVASEALADAGITVGSELASRTGVYAGMNTTDYQQRLTRHQSEVDVYFGTGNCFAATPGRLAFALNLGGPCLSVDTACSSSLTAVHLASQALRSGDCDAAVVGGVNVISGPTVSISMARAGALAPDGRCKTFSDAADGYGRGEGAGVIVLKRLERAVADGDRIYATVLGSALNSDGASGGFTVPNANAQTEVITAALSAAGVSARDIGYVEAHGTGTALGDPIELQALSKALRPDPDSPVSVGSVKSLIGHLEAAAGMVGLIKAALSVNRGEIPPHALVGERTSRINWHELGLRLSEQTAGWPQRPQRVAGVSAFGFTGSNAHVILGQPPASGVPAAAPSDGATALALSADTPVALREHAAQLVEILASGTPLGDLAYTLARHRSSYRYRAVVLAGSAAGARHALTELAAGRPHPDVVLGSRAVAEPCGIDFHFSADGYLGADWAFLPDELRVAGNEAAAEVDRLTQKFSPGLTASQRQRLATLRAQVGWSAIWQRVGLHRSSASGEGVGAQAAALARGDISLGTAVDRALHADHNDDLSAGNSGPADDENGSVVVEVVPMCVATASWSWVQAHSYVAGYDVDWNSTVPDTGRRITLPAYPWQRRDYWFTAAAAEQPVTPAGPRPQLDQVGARAAEGVPVLPDERLGAVRELLFTHDWQPAEIGPSTEGRGRWLIFADVEAPPAAHLARELQDAGHDIQLLAIPQSGTADWTSALAAAAAGGSITGAVLMVCDRQDAESLTMRFGQAVQGFPGSLGRAHLITRGANPVNGGTSRPEQAAAWAVGAVLATELSRRWGRLIDLAETASADGLAAALVSEHLDDQLHLDDGRWYCRRIHRQLDMPDPEAAIAGQGKHFAVYAPDSATVEPVLRWLAGKGAGAALVHLPGSAAVELGDTTLSIRTVTDQGSWLDQLAELAGAGELGGVVHCALYQDEPVTVRDSDPETQDGPDPAVDLLAAVLSRLGAAGATTPAGLILLLTDAAGDWGALGAAASGARSARARATLREHPELSGAARTLSLLPREHPAAATATSVLQADSGIGQLSAEQIIEVLDYAVSVPAGIELSAGVVDVERYVTLCQRLAPRALLDELGAAGSEGDDKTEVLAELRALSPARRSERLMDLVLTATASLLGLSARELDPDTGFFDLGMDSIIAVSLKTRLENETRTELPTTLTFELPTPRKVARHLTQLLEPTASKAATAQQPAQASREGRPDAFDGAAQVDQDAGNDPTALEATDDELLLMLSQATASARDLLQEARQW